MSLERSEEIGDESSEAKGARRARRVKREERGEREARREARREEREERGESLLPVGTQGGPPAQVLVDCTSLISHIIIVTSRTTKEFLFAQSSLPLASLASSPTILLNQSILK